MGARLEYIEAVDRLDQARKAAIGVGLAAEVVAHMAHAGRNALKIVHRRDLTDADFMRIAWRNINRYGNPIEPSVVDNFQKYGDWQGVIAAAGRTGGQDLGF